MQQQIDTLIQAEWIIPVVPEGEVLENHALAIDGGRIIGLLPVDQAASRYQAENRLELPGAGTDPRSGQRSHPSRYVAAARTGR